MIWVQILYDMASSGDIHKNFKMFKFLFKNRGQNKVFHKENHSTKSLTVGNQRLQVLQMQAQ